jgi:hypothetical protein
MNFYRDHVAFFHIFSGCMLKFPHLLSWIALPFLC